MEAVPRLPMLNIPMKTGVSSFALTQAISKVFPTILIEALHYLTSFPHRGLQLNFNSMKKDSTFIFIAVHKRSLS